MSFEKSLVPHAFFPETLTWYVPRGTLSTVIRVKALPVSDVATLSARGADPATMA